MEKDALITEAFSLAVHTRKQAHVPYSQFQVGAAVKWQHSDQLYGGCNVENASYGLAICAERVAITRAIASEGKGLIAFVLVVTDQHPPSVPCAACLQFIAEFSHPQTDIYLADTNKVQEIIAFSSLLPRPFRSFSV